jgi:hypothetical protein
MGIPIHEVIFKKANEQNSKTWDDEGNEEIYKEDPLDDKEVNFICKETKIEENIFNIPS